MTVVVLRPNGTTSNTATLVGAATAHAALSDDSDASYLDFVGGNLAELTVGDVTLPAGAVMKSVQARARLSGSDQVDLIYVSGGSVIAGAGSQFGPGAASTVTVGPPNATASVALINAATHVANLTGGGSARLFEAMLDVTYAAKPVVVVDAPTGTVTTTNQPLVSWTNTLDAAGGAQTRATVKIFTAAQYGAGGFDPATSTATASETVTGAATSQTLAAVLPNDTYRAYVQVAQTVNGAEHASDYAFSGFVINVTPPANPTVVATPVAAAGRNEILITSGGGATSTDRVELQRSTDGGTTWAAVRNSETTAGTIAYAAPVTIYDYEAPNGSTTDYRARALHNYSGLYAASAWVQTTALWTSTSGWLKDPLAPAVNAPVALVAYGQVQRSTRAGVFQPLGAELALVVSDTRASMTGEAQARTTTTAQRDVLQAAAERQAILLLQAPAGSGEPDRYVRIGDISTARQVENVNRAMRTLTLPWVEVAAPVGVQTGAQYVAGASSPEELILI